VDSAQVGVLEELGHIGLCGLLYGHQGVGLEAEIAAVYREVLGHLARRWKGSLQLRSSVDFWYLQISRGATLPGLKRLDFLSERPSRRAACGAPNLCNLLHLIHIQIRHVISRQLNQQAFLVLLV